MQFITGNKGFHHKGAFSLGEEMDVGYEMKSVIILIDRPFKCSFVCFLA